MTPSSAATATATIALLPAGIIMPYVGSAASLAGLVAQGWHYCDGSLLSATTYPRLFKALDSAYGTATAGHFYLPDLRGLFLRGVDATSKVDPEAHHRAAMRTGGNTGANIGSFQRDDIGPHSHPLTAHAHDPGFQNGRDKTAGSLYSPAQANTINPNAKTLPYGGDESRPVNSYVHYLIYNGQQ